MRAYHDKLMVPPLTNRFTNLFAVCKRAILAILLVLLATPVLSRAQEILPLSRVKPGMEGEALTIFSGDTIEKFNLVVIGVMPNFLGPKQPVILVRLEGPKVEHTGVVAGMSGSPVYFDGKLAGALSLKLGQFAKEPLAGVTPIESMLNLTTGNDATATADQQAQNSGEAPARSSQQLGLPQEWASRAGVTAGAFLEPIEAPLVFSGFNAAAIRQYAHDLSPYGMLAMQGGTAEARPDDAKIQPGDMVSMELLRGDLSIGASCTVTAMIRGRVYVCGHPFLSFGAVNMPMARARVLTTLSSDLESTKIVNVGGTIGAFQQDSITAVVGSLGAPPAMIPMDLTVSSPAGENHEKFEMVSNPKLTPLLVGLAAFNGLVQNGAYSEGTTLHLSGAIDIAGHPSVSLENLFAPTDAFIPDGTFVAGSVQSVFQRIFSNPYETAKIQHVSLRLESLPERRQMTIETAWPEKTEAEPGESIRVKVQLRPYRGSPLIRDVPVTIPLQAERGSAMQILVSDSGTLNRMVAVAGSTARLENLDQLIALLNRERRNNRVYITLLESKPTLLVQDKVMPNAPLSEINLFDRRTGGPGSIVVRESAAGEWSVPLDQVVQGSTSITIRIK